MNFFMENELHVQKIKLFAVYNVMKGYTVLLFIGKQISSIFM